MIFLTVSSFIRHFLQSSVANRRQWPVMLVSLVLAGCAGTGALTPEAPNDQKVAAVSERAEARWKALIDNDIPAAYAYISPTTRDVVSLERYKASFGGEVKYRAARVEKVSCEADACKVRMLVTYDHRLMKGITTPIDESWVLDKGQFWFLFRG
jgi:hypothetical protein